MRKYKWEVIDLFRNQDTDPLSFRVREGEKYYFGTTNPTFDGNEFHCDDEVLWDVGDLELGRHKFLGKHYLYFNTNTPTERPTEPILFVNYYDVEFIVKEDADYHFKYADISFRYNIFPEFKVEFGDYIIDKTILYSVKEDRYFHDDILPLDEFIGDWDGWQYRRRRNVITEHCLIKDWHYYYFHYVEDGEPEYVEDFALGKRNWRFRIPTTDLSVENRVTASKVYIHHGPARAMKALTETTYDNQLYKVAHFERLDWVVDTINVGETFAVPAGEYFLVGNSANLPEIAIEYTPNWYTGASEILNKARANCTISNTSSSRKPTITGADGCRIVINNNYSSPTIYDEVWYFHIEGYPGQYPADGWLGDAYYYTDETYDMDNPSFDSGDLIGGINYEKNINGGTDLNVGDVATAQISFTTYDKAAVELNTEYAWYHGREESKLLGYFFITDFQRTLNGHYQYTGYDCMHKLDASADEFIELSSNAADNSYHWKTWEWDMDDTDLTNITLRPNIRYYLDDEIDIKDVSDVRMKSPKYETIAPRMVQGFDVNLEDGWAANVGDSPNNLYLVIKDSDVRDFGHQHIADLFTSHRYTSGNVHKGWDVDKTYKYNRLTFNYEGENFDNIWQRKTETFIEDYGDYTLWRVSNWFDLTNDNPFFKFNESFNVVNNDNRIHWEGAIELNNFDTSKYYYSGADTQVNIMRYVSGPLAGYSVVQFYKLNKVANPVRFLEKDWFNRVPIIWSDTEGERWNDSYYFKFWSTDLTGQYIWMANDSLPYYITGMDSTKSQTQMIIYGKRMSLELGGEVTGFDIDDYLKSGSIIEGSNYTYYELNAIPQIHTIEDLFTSVCNYVGIRYLIPNSVSDAWQFNIENKFQSQGKTFKDLLSYIGQFLAAYVHSNRDGNATLDWYKEKQIYLTPHEYVRFNQTEYDVPKIDRLQITNNNDINYITYGVGSNALYIKDNPLFMVDDTTTLNQYVGDIFTKVYDYPEYNPGTIELLEDIDIEPGDIVYLLDEYDNPTAVIMVFSKSINARRVTLSSTGNPTRETYRTSSYKTKNNVNGNYSSVTENTKEVSFEVGDEGNDSSYKLYVDSTGIYAQKNGEAPVPIYQ